MKNDKPFKNVEEQVKILESRNLTFLDKKRAKEVLSFFGYYEIINGYKYPFMLSDKDDKYGFIDGTTFEHIYALYHCDKNIRDSVRIVMEDFEQNFKQSISNVISSNISEIFDVYSSKENFNTGNIYKHGRSDRSKLINKMYKAKNSEREPFKYYREKHGNVPPWIICKSLTFGQSIYWYSLSKPEIQNKIIANMLNGVSVEMINNLDEELQIKQAFADALRLFLDYRNISSHCGRTFNHRSKKYQIRNYDAYIYKNVMDTSKGDFKKGKYRSSIGLIVRLLKLFKNDSLSIELSARISFYSNKYLQKYPKDFYFLIDSMELGNSDIEKAIIKEFKKTVRNLKMDDVQEPKHF